MLRRLLLAVVGLAAVCSAVQTEGLTYEQTAWRSALYYRTTFEAPEAGEGLLHMAAADSFAAYFNGELVGSDSSAVQPRVFAVPVVRGDNHIAALVVNRGRGRGNGLAVTLAVEFAAGDTATVQTTTDRTRQPWYWSDQFQMTMGGRLPRWRGTRLGIWCKKVPWSRLCPSASPSPAF